MNWNFINENDIRMFLRWVHLVAGAGWLGSLYYIHFVENNFFDKSAPDKSTLRFLRVTSLLTVITGAVYIIMSYKLTFRSSWGIDLLTGSALALVMWVNLILFSSSHKKLRPSAGTLARTAVVFSIPMLFFMSSASHLGFSLEPTTSVWPWIAVVAAIVLILEVNALTLQVGKTPSRWALLVSGAVLTIIMVLLRVLLLP